MNHSEKDAEELVLSMFDRQRRYGNTFDLFTNPIYRDLSPTAKLLYLFLKDQTEKMEDHDSEMGRLDDRGAIYIESDNTDIKTILNVSEPTLIKAKKELESLNLLYQEPNRLYFLKFHN